ncbi:diadenylate cyclase CdaA [bacterium]|nr:diadenylate cyclase CdaA [bacterium]RQV98661.1 MAG: TIGR00159 family protein [bacterium]
MSGIIKFQIFKIGFLPFGLIDLLDIILVTYILYKLYFIMHRTRAVQMFTGIVLIFLISFFAQALDMQEMAWLFRNLRTIWLIAFVILFQPELRRALILMGQSRFVRIFTKEQTNVVVEEIARGAIELSQRGYGALIVIVRDIGVRIIVETGIKIQSLVTSSLIVSIFNPRSPLHDGAIVIQNDIIEAAKCILPLSRNPMLEYRWGTRHRAAIGMSEESDAVIVVVSEETGAISIVQHGEIVSGIDKDILVEKLNESLRYGSRK